MMLVQRFSPSTVQFLISNHTVNVFKTAYTPRRWCGLIEFTGSSQVYYFGTLSDHRLLYHDFFIIYIGKAMLRSQTAAGEKAEICIVDSFVKGCREMLPDREHYEKYSELRKTFLEMYYGLEPFFKQMLYSSTS